MIDYNKIIIGIRKLREVRSQVEELKGKDYEGQERKNVQSNLWAIYQEYLSDYSQYRKYPQLLHNDSTIVNNPMYWQRNFQAGIPDTLSAIDNGIELLTSKIPDNLQDSLIDDSPKIVECPKCYHKFEV